MNLAAQINVIIQVFGGLISLVIIIFLFFGKQMRGRLDNLFIRYLFCNLSLQLSNALSWIFDGANGEFGIFIARASTLGMFAFSYIIIAALTSYMTAFTFEKDDTVRVPTKSTWGFAGFAIVVTFTMQCWDLYFSFDAHNVYHRGELFWVSIVFAAFSMIPAFRFIFVYKKVFSLREFTIFLSYFIFPFVAAFGLLFSYGNIGIQIVIAILPIVIYLFIQAEQDRKYIKTQLALERSRTALMLSQINPHFMFNTLTSIRTMCVETPEKAEKAISEFSDFLRGNIDSLCDDELISFDKEYEHLMHYLYIEKLRFEHKLTVVTDIQTTNFKLGALTIQPIVENAVNHGTSKKQDGGTVTISTKETADHFEIIIADDGIGFDVDTASQNIGISNVRYRLQAQCGGSLAISSNIGAGTTAIIKIPKEWRKNA